MPTDSPRGEVCNRHDRTMLGRLCALVAAGLFTVGVAAYAGHTVADSGGNGNGNGNGGGSEQGNGGESANGNGNGRGGEQGNGGESANGDGNGDDNENGAAGQVVICHVPPGNPDNDHTIEIGSPAVDAHVENHGDSVGPCDDATSTTTSTSTTTTDPTSTSTTTTSTTTSSTSTTTSTTTTLPGVAPNAVSDIAAAVPVGQMVSVSVLANDNLGVPAAAIVQSDFDAVGACSGLSFDPAAGLLSGTPTEIGACLFTYVVQNSAGFDAAAVFVPVIA